MLACPCAGLQRQKAETVGLMRGELALPGVPRALPCRRQSPRVGSADRLAPPSLPPSNTPPSLPLHLRHRIQRAHIAAVAARVFQHIAPPHRAGGERRGSVHRDTRQHVWRAAWQGKPRWSGGGAGRTGNGPHLLLRSVLRKIGVRVRTWQVHEQNLLRNPSLAAVCGAPRAQGVRDRGGRPAKGLRGHHADRHPAPDRGVRRRARREVGWESRAAASCSGGRALSRA